jgi:hypothetical protein
MDGVPWYHGFMVATGRPAPIEATKMAAIEATMELAERVDT